MIHAYYIPCSTELVALERERALSVCVALFYTQIVISEFFVILLPVIKDEEFAKESKGIEHSRNNADYPSGFSAISGSRNLLRNQRREHKSTARKLSPELSAHMV